MALNAIVCNCGQPIGRRNVIHTSLYPRPFGPSLVRVRYRCPHCRRRKEVFVGHAEWSAGVFDADRPEVRTAERQRFDSLGRISLREQADVHRELDSDDLLERLNREFPDENSAPRER